MESLKNMHREGTLALILCICFDMSKTKGSTSCSEQRAAGCCSYG